MYNFQNLRKEVNQNLNTFSTTYDAPNNGHLVLGITDTKYFVSTGLHYAVPLDPVIYDVTIGATVSHVIRSPRKTEHNEA